MIGKILSITDNAGLLYEEVAREEWRRHGFEVINTNIEDPNIDIEMALREADFDQYCLIGITVENDNTVYYLPQLRLLRELTNVPIVLFPCDNFDSELERNTLNAGADQVIPLPANMINAITRCLALIRRDNDLSTRKDKTSKFVTMYVSYRLFLDFSQYSAHVDGKEIVLQRKEFEILRYLMEHRGRVMTYEQIFRAVWGEEYVDNAKSTLWSHIRNLRDKLQIAPDLPEYIITRHGYGYSFDPQFDKN